MIEIDKKFDQVQNFPHKKIIEQHFRNQTILEQNFPHQKNLYNCHYKTEKDFINYKFNYLTTSGTNCT